MCADDTIECDGIVSDEVRNVLRAREALLAMPQPSFNVDSAVACLARARAHRLELDELPSQSPCARSLSQIEAFMSEVPALPLEGEL